MAPGAGKDLYFSFNLSLKRSEEPRSGHIYKIGTVPLTTIAGPNDNSRQPFQGVNVDLFQVDTSRNGETLAYSGRTDCYADMVTCTYSTHVSDPLSGMRWYEGAGRLSGNGRYLASFIPSPTTASSTLSLIDLRTGQLLSRTLLDATYYRFSLNGRVVADDGTFVMFNEREVFVFRRGRLVTTGTGYGSCARDPVINAAGDTVVHWACGSPSQLRLFRPETGEDTSLSEGLEPVLSSDGQRIAFLRVPNPAANGPMGRSQLYTINLDGTGIQTLTDEVNGVFQFTLSDDGRIAWYTTTNGALFELDVASQQKRQRIPQTGYAYMTYDLSPGSAFRIQGNGLVQIQELPWTEYKLPFSAALAPQFGRRFHGRSRRLSQCSFHSMTDRPLKFSV